MYIHVTLNLVLNLLNELVYLPFLELSIIILGISICELEDGQPTIQLGQSAQMCRLAWLYIGHKG